VELAGSNDTYRVVTPGVIAWGPAQIKVRLGALPDGTLTLLDVTNAPIEQHMVPIPQELYAGAWQVRVITDYFKKGGGALYNKGADGLNPNYELVFREISEPATFTVTKDPNINGVGPDPVLGTVTKASPNPATITGVNFGTTRGPAVIRVAAPKNHSKYADTKAKVIMWSNTEIKFWLKYAAYPKTKDIQIVLNPGSPPAQQKKSNWFRITVVAP
jgi:hypothetical protein